MISGEVLKYRKGLFIYAGYESGRSSSSGLSLTGPGPDLDRGIVDIEDAGTVFIDSPAHRRERLAATPQGLAQIVAIEVQW